MILINLFFLKNSNGMFYYALDYLSYFSENSRVLLLLRHGSGLKIPSNSNVDVVYVSFWSLLYFLVFKYRQFKIFCPTPHPIPFCTSQTIVVHDEYPFKNGLISGFKFSLLRIGVYLSKCTIGFINKSNSLKFCVSAGFSKLLYMPNSFGNGITLHNKVSETVGLIIGLIGTDSEKKNHEGIFEVLGKSDISFYVFGHDSDYFGFLISRYPHINIQLVPSDRQSIGNFFNKVDVIISNSMGEGFGRLYSCAMQSGISCILRKDSAFLEFYEGSATFFDDESELPCLVDELVFDYQYCPIAIGKNRSKAEDALLNAVNLMLETCIQ